MAQRPVQIQTKLEKKPLVEKKRRPTIAGFLNRTFDKLDRTLREAHDSFDLKKKKKPK